MVETLSELLENAANVAEDNGGKLSIASAAALIAEAYEDFFAILKKYNLYCGPISTFSGFIPSENVSQIAKASNALNSLNLNYVS